MSKAAEDTNGLDVELHGWRDVILPTRAIFRLSAPALRTYAYLIFRARNDPLTFVGNARAAQDLGITVPTLQRHYDELEEKHFIKRKERPGHSSYTYIFKEEEDYQQAMKNGRVHKNLGGNKNAKYPTKKRGTSPHKNEAHKDYSPKEKTVRRKKVSSPASLTIVAAEDDEPAAPRPVQEKPQRHPSITDEALAKWSAVREWYAAQLSMGDQPAYRQCQLVAVVGSRAVVVAPNRLKADFWNNERVQTMLRKELKRQFGEAVTGVQHITADEPLPGEAADEKAA